MSSMRAERPHALLPDARCVGERDGIENCGCRDCRTVPAPAFATEHFLNDLRDRLD